MATGQDLINAADTFLGEPYDQGPGRTDPNSGYKDCSGLIAACYQVVTGAQPPANVSVTIYDWARSAGLAISRQQADGIAGACYLMPDDPDQGWGDAGHIGFSDGVGGTREATPPCVQHLSNTYQSWGPEACLLPGIDYSGAVPGPNYGGAHLIIGDEGNGAIYLLGAKTAYHIPVPEDVERLKYIGVPDAGMQPTLTVISWMKTFGAWPY